MRKAEAAQRAPELRVGDRVRILDLPRIGGLHRDTRRAYKALIAKGRSVRICRMDDSGLPWFSFRVKLKSGGIEYHSMCIAPNDSNWIR
jgi:hypothetical protein